MPSARASVGFRLRLGGILAIAAWLALSCLSPSLAWAQTLYKWVDKDGKTQYSDKPPAGFGGEITKIEADPAPVQGTRVKAARPERAEEEDKAPDVATSRRTLRELLAARLAAARAKLGEAKKALADGEDPLDDEKQMIQQRFNRDARRPDRTPAPRSNCMSRVETDGKTTWVCPVPIPGESYFTRQSALEEAVRKAEEEVAAAEQAYRRGVD